MTKTRSYSWRPAANETANVITHATGLALSIPAVYFLLKQAHTSALFWSSLIYGLTLVAVYAASTSLHAASQHRLRYQLEVLDHSAIYLLIAGTATPFLVRVGGMLGTLLLIGAWSMAATGVAFKLIFGLRHPRLSMASYLLTGWFPILAIRPILHATSWSAVEWLIIGGAAYTVGVLFYVASQKRFSLHPIWHIFVMLGSASHYLAVLFCVRS